MATNLGKKVNPFNITSAVRTVRLDGVAERGGAVSADGVSEGVSEEVTFVLRPGK